MVVTVWSVKGGSGTSVVAAAMAVLAARSDERGVVFVDLAGDAAAVLGVSENEEDGLGTWLAASADASMSVESLARIEQRVDERLSVLPWGDAPDPGADLTVRVQELGARLAADGRTVVVDAGTVEPRRAEGQLERLRRRCIESSDRSLLVVRCCYLALRQATRSALRPDGVVVVTEPGRSLTPLDVESVVGVPVVAQIGVDAQIARVVDAGLLPSRLGRSVERALRDVVTG